MVEKGRKQSRSEKRPKLTDGYIKNLLFNGFEHGSPPAIVVVEDDDLSSADQSHSVVKSPRKNDITNEEILQLLVSPEVITQKKIGNGNSEMKNPAKK